MSVLKLDQVASTRPGGDLLGPVSMHIDKPHCVSLMGPTGAGREDLIDVIAGRQEIRTGTVKLAGSDITMADAMTRLSAGFVRSRFDLPLPQGLTLRQLLVLARLNRDMPARSLISHSLTLLPPDGQADLLSAIEALGLQSVLDRQLATFDAVQACRTRLALAKLSKPRLFVAERPFSRTVGMPRDQMRHELQTFCAVGCAVLIIDDCAMYLAEFCDQMLVMTQGRLIANGTPDEVGNDVQAIEALTGRPALS